MKVRNGFVSNSSSSSFLIWGTPVSCSAVYAVSMEDDDWVCNCNMVEMPDGDDYYYFGRCPSTGRDDETFAAFKQRVELEVTTLLTEHNVETKDLVFGWQEASWFG